MRARINHELLQQCATVTNPVANVQDIERIRIANSISTVQSKRKISSGSNSVNDEVKRNQRKMA